MLRKVELLVNAHARTSIVSNNVVCLAFRLGLAWSGVPNKGGRIVERST